MNSLIAYFDCFAGISGDMVLGALVDLGVKPLFLSRELKKLSIDNYNINFSAVKRGVISGKNVNVVQKGGYKKHRTFSDIKNLVRKSSLKKSVIEQSLQIFENLATAEAKIHKIKKEDVHFHEIGSVDSIVDIIGTVLGLDFLNINTIYSSHLPLSSGWVKCEHGTLPLPAPATLEILKDIPIYSTKWEWESVTPTGAAILKTLAKDFGPMPSMVIKSIGYGAGSHIDKKIPNLLRIVVGDKKGEVKSELATVIETNIDDMNPQLYENLINRLFENGASDVFLTSVQMKKFRPGINLTIVTESDNIKKLIDIVFQETTTIGVRYYNVFRKKLNRKIEKIKTPFGPVMVKISLDEYGKKKIMPEYEDCKRIALSRGIPLKKVFEEIYKFI